MKIIIKKENEEQWQSLKMIKTYRIKLIGKIMKKYYEIKGYEVEGLEKEKE